MNNVVYRYTTLKPARTGYYLMLLALCVLAGLGYYCAHTMDVAGHHITGMNNRVVWGLPHVFAVWLVVAASGALNGATLASVFGLDLYKPCARLSVVLAMALLVGGLAILVLDLGRPDRLIIAMTTFNFRSVFAWNIFLYNGFLLVCIVYLWFICERRFNRYAPVAGIVAFGWRMALTTATGCIFGFLVGRNALDSAMLAPLFIALSLVLGTSVLTLVLLVTARVGNRELSIGLKASVSRLLLWFVLAHGYLSLVHHLTNLYVVEHHGSEQLVLSGNYAWLFWVGYVLIGIVLPVALLVAKGKAITGDRTAHSKIPPSDRRLYIACICSAVGGAVWLYLTIIGSQATAQRLFPGKTVVSSSFGDAGIASYYPGVWEWGLGVGGVSLALLLFTLALRVFPFVALAIDDRQQPNV